VVHHPSNRSERTGEEQLTEPDTIAAIATPPGRGGIGIVRVSGALARDILEQIAGDGIEPRLAVLRAFRAHDGELIDRGLVLFFEGPRSFTGEDIAELHGHGGPVVMDLLLAAAIDAGARLARPGEFTERAFLNGQIDLAQAEAVADLIDSASRAAARSAARSLSGEFSARIEALAQATTELRAYVEASIDFPEEEVDFLADGAVGEKLRSLIADVDALLGNAQQGALLTEGIRLVIAGAPNVGKSSLLNRLTGYERAIVTAVPGTTRDTLSEHINLDGIPVKLIDTAGLRTASDPIEEEGIRRTRAEIATADRILWVCDATEPSTYAVPQDLPNDRLTIVVNKIDLEPASIGTSQGAVRVSALTGEGIDALKGHLKRLVGFRDEEGLFSARRRHVDALSRAAAHLRDALDQLVRNGAGELVAEDLRIAHERLGEIVGRVSADALLGVIFSRFCIGK
jgi:tRNA modification GTPase